MTKKSYLLKSLIILVGFQIILNLGKVFLCPLFPDEIFYEQITTMVLMIILTLGFVLFLKIKNYKIAVFPDNFNQKYVLFTVIAVILSFSNSSLYNQGFIPVIRFIYGFLVTPVFEELLFRGYLWQEGEKISESKYMVAINNIIMFTIWHLGYMIPALISHNYVAVFTKLLIGFGYGVILCIVRIKTGNVYSTILVHGLLNSFLG